MLRYHLFFRKEIYFFWIFIFQWIRYSSVCTCFLVEEASPINKVRLTLVGRLVFIWNAYSCLYGEGLWRLMCTYALTLSLFMFLAASWYIDKKLTSCLFKKYVFVRNSYFLPTMINSCRHEINFFYFKRFLRTKGNQNAFIVNQTES